MKELSLHILDILQNSASAGASRVELTLVQDAAGVLTFTIKDNGCGMTPDFLASVTDPFTTSRTTRKVGLGLPLLRMACEQTEGRMTIESTVNVGTTVTAVFHTRHIDCPPMGDLAGSLALFVQGLPELDLCYARTTPKGSFAFETAQLREILGSVSLSEPEVALWLGDYIRENEAPILND